VYFSHNGTTRYSHFSTPLVVLHNDTAGLQGGSTGEYYHLTAAQVAPATAVASTTSLGLAPQATAPASGLVSVLAIANGETVRTDKALFDTTNAAALGTAGPGTAVVAARRDHIHANPAIDTLAAATDITTLNATTSAHGLVVKATAPGTGIINAVCIANGETAYTNKSIYAGGILQTKVVAAAPAVGDQVTGTLYVVVPA
jgi:hypothetical protein